MAAARLEQVITNGFGMTRPLWSLAVLKKSSNTNDTLKVANNKRCNGDAARATQGCPQRRVQIQLCGTCEPQKLVFRTSTLARSASTLSPTCQILSCHALRISSHVKAEVAAKPKTRPMQAHGTERLALTCPLLGTCEEARGPPTEDVAKLFSTMRPSGDRGASSLNWFATGVRVVVRVVVRAGLLRSML